MGPPSAQEFLSARSTPVVPDSRGVVTRCTRLTFETFRRYTSALSRAFHPSGGYPSWEDLRLRLGLHPMEASHSCRTRAWKASAKRRGGEGRG